MHLYILFPVLSILFIEVREMLVIEDVKSKFSMDINNRQSSSEPQLLTVYDYEAGAKGILPKYVLDYVSNGADFNFTLRENTEAFKRLRIRPRQLHEVGNIKTEITLLRDRVSFPIGICPTAFQMLYCPEGEKATARAAEASNTVMILSSYSTTSIQDVSQAAPSSIRWMQMYPYKNRTLNQLLMMQAERYGFKAIVLTVDSPVSGRKLNMIRNNFSLPKTVRLPILEYLFGCDYNTSPDEVLELSDMNFDADFGWSDLQSLSRLTRLPIIAKGILTGTDALKAINNGARGIIVSNHGGRQLDGAPASIEALTEVLKAVRHLSDVYMDSGVRTGIDAFKALAIGAKAVFVGRPVVWGLANGCAGGATKVLSILKGELIRTMKLAGSRSLKDITGSQVVRENYYSNLWNPITIP